MFGELDRKRQCVETAPGGGKIPASMEGNPIRRGPEHGVREGARGSQPPSRDTRPDRATRFLETTLGTLSYSELAPDSDDERKAYFEALESADHANWQPLSSIWERRLENNNR